MEEEKLSDSDEGALLTEEFISSDTENSSPDSSSPLGIYGGGGTLNGRKKQEEP